MASDTRDPLAVAIGSVAILGALLSVVSLGVNERFAIFAGPVALHAVLILLAEGTRRLAPLSRPLNGYRILTVLELGRGVAVPVLVQYLGQDAPILRDLGTPSSGAGVLLIGSMFFAAFLVTHAAIARMGTRTNSGLPLAEHLTQRTETIWIAFAAVGLGLVGTVLRFPNPTSLADFLTFSSVAQEPFGGVLGLLATTLRPLLPLGLVVLLVAHRRSGRRVVIPLAVVLAISAYVTLASYNLNRSAFLMPTLALLLVCVGYLGVRIRLRTALSLAMLGVVVFLGVGLVRQALKGVASLSAGAGGFVSNSVQTLLVYGQSPLQAAPVLDTEWSRHFNLATLVNSIVFPLPGIPSWVRDASGAMRYNEILYGDDSLGRDQIIPSWFEMFVSIGWAGPIILGAIVALLIRAMDVYFANARSIFAAYASSLTAIWLAQLSISSISAVGQAVLLFCVPPAAVAVIAALVRNRRARRDEEATGSAQARSGELNA